MLAKAALNVVGRTHVVGSVRALQHIDDPWLGTHVLTIPCCAEGSVTKRAAPVVRRNARLTAGVYHIVQLVLVRHETVRAAWGIPAQLDPLVELGSANICVDVEHDRVDLAQDTVGLEFFTHGTVRKERPLVRKKKK